MNDIWDCQADEMKNGDNLRIINSITKDTYEDIDGFTHYVFSKKMFENSRYLNLNKLGNILIKLHDLIFDKLFYPDTKIEKISRVSVHWQKYLKTHGHDKTRELIHSDIIEQGNKKVYYSKNLRHFAEDILKLLNSKLQYCKVVFEIYDEETILFGPKNPTSELIKNISNISD